MDGSRTITLGDTTLKLSFIGLNHSDSSLVMRLPKQKVLFAVAFIPVGTVLGRELIPGHPGAPNGRLGTKQDVQNLLTFLQDASAAVKAEAQAGKCWDPVEKELKLPKYDLGPWHMTIALPIIRLMPDPARGSR